MKPVGTSVPQSAGNLLPAFAAKGEAAGDSFQAALAQALLGAGQAVPTTPPVAQIDPASLPERPVPIEGQTAVDPVPSPSPHPVALPIPNAVVSPLPIFESRPTGSPKVVPTALEPSAAVPSLPQPFLESRPKAASSPQAGESKPKPSVFPAVAPGESPFGRLGELAEPAEGDAAQPNAPPVPASPKPASMHIPAMRPQATRPQATRREPTPRDKEPAAPVALPVRAPAEPIAPVPETPELKNRPSDGGITKEPAPDLPQHVADVVQVPLPPLEQATPFPLPAVTARPAVVLMQTGGEPLATSKAPITRTPTAKARPQSPHVTSTTATDPRSPALDALLPTDPREDREPGSRGKSPTTPALVESHDDPLPERLPVAAKITVEEVHVESTATPAAASAAKEQDLKHTEASKPEVEPMPVDGRGEGIPAQSRPIAHDGSPHATEASTQMRHPEEAPQPAVPTDRVTLRLPDEAGGGRVQIAVRGDVVHARIVNADEAGTREMTAGLDELRSALTRQGFQETHVRIDSRPAVTDGGWMRATAGRESAGAGDNRPQDSQSQDSKERHPDYSEDRAPDSRRQKPDGRSQQRSRRERER